MFVLNKVILIGSVASAPEVRSTNNGCAVSSFKITTSVPSKNSVQRPSDQVKDCHNIVLFGKLATISGRCFREGSIVYIEGRLKTRYRSSASGPDRSVAEVIGYDAQLLASPGATNNPVLGL